MDLHNDINDNPIMRRSNRYELFGSYTGQWKHTIRARYYYISTHYNPFRIRI